MHPRIRRLTADHRQMTTAFAEHPFIRILETEGNPPEKYKLEFQVLGLVPTGEDTHQPAPSHQAEVFLPMDYPRRQPLCRMTTPVFHPNIDPRRFALAITGAPASRWLSWSCGSPRCFPSRVTTSRVR